MGDSYQDRYPVIMSFAPPGPSVSWAEPVSAGRPATLLEVIPTSLRGTPLGMTLATRIITEGWQPIELQDVPDRWLPVLHNRPKKFEDGRLTDNPHTGCGTIAFTMPDDAVCRIYKKWFEKLPPSEGLDIVTFMESTESFIQAYGLDTWHRTMLSLAVHGKPEAIFVQIAPAQ